MDDNIFLQTPKLRRLLNQLIMDPDPMTLGLEREARGVELRINTNKTKVLRVVSHRIPVDKFVCLESVVSADGGTNLDVLSLFLRTVFQF